MSATPDPDVQPPPSKPPSAPPAPSSVTATRGDGTIVASWYHSEGATGYDVRYSTDNGSTWKLAAWHWNTSVITIKGTSGSKSYIVGVRARNNVGASDWTNSNMVAPLPVPGPVSVSNLGSTVVGESNVGSFFGAMIEQANAFTTGPPRSAGYTLASVSVQFATTTGTPANIVVALHESSEGNPAPSAQVTLTGSNPTSPGTYTYTCSAGDCSLSPNATYFLVLSAPSSPHHQRYNVQLTSADDETNTPSGNGWSLANTGKYHYQVWSDHDDGKALLFRIDAN